MAEGLTQYSLHQLWDMVRNHDHEYVYRHVQAWEKGASHLAGHGGSARLR